MKTAIIIPYFGNFPSFFQAFLDSCKYNTGFEWLVFTDNTAPYKYPENVHVRKMSMEECRTLIQSKFDFPIALPRPWKLCDFRPAFGYIFEEYLTGYDFWGHCDCDLIFGDLSKFVTEEDMRRFDKIGIMSHLGLYRNTEENNRVFMSEIRGKKRYREVFSSEVNCLFDEWMPDNVNEIYLERGIPTKTDLKIADIDQYRTNLARIYWNIEAGEYERDKVQNSIFRCEPGHVYQLYEENGGIAEREYAYVHLLRRKMDNLPPAGAPYYIVPNRFVEIDKDPKKLLRARRIWTVINYRGWKRSLQTRMNNLRGVLKMGGLRGVLKKIGDNLGGGRGKPFEGKES